MSLLICGIDPGLNGAFAFLNIEELTLQIVAMPTFEKNSLRHTDPAEVAAVINHHRPTHAFLEAVYSSPQMGVRSAFSFGRSAGIIQGALHASQASPEVCQVVPSVWKPAMGAPADKKKTLARASQLMPDCASAWKRVKDDGRAEAALLALYGAVKMGLKVGNLTLKDT